MKKHKGGPPRISGQRIEECVVLIRDSHKTHSSQKLAKLLLRIDIAICRVGDMHCENAQVHILLFLYCSGGERSVMCVRPVLEMEASKEEQRGVVRFLVAEGAATHHKAKCPGILSDGIILFHYNARLHTANQVRDTLRRFDWEIFQHLPYNPDISPCDVHILAT